MYLEKEYVSVCNFTVLNQLSHISILKTIQNYLAIKSFGS